MFSDLKELMADFRGLVADLAALRAEDPADDAVKMSVYKMIVGMLFGTNFIW